MTTTTTNQAPQHVRCKLCLFRVANRQCAKGQYCYKCCHYRSEEDDQVCLVHDAYHREIQNKRAKRDQNISMPTDMRVKRLGYQPLITRTSSSNHLHASFLPQSLDDDLQQPQTSTTDAHRLHSLDGPLVPQEEQIEEDRSTKTAIVDTRDTTSSAPNHNVDVAATIATVAVVAATKTDNLSSRQYQDGTGLYQS